MIAAAGSLTAAGLGTGLAGCDGQPSDPGTSTPAIDPLTPVLLGQQQLLSTYERALSAFPELAPALSDLQSQSTAHTDALIGAAPAAAAQVAATGSGSPPSGSSAATAEKPPTPAFTDAASALAALGRAVQSAAGALRAAALRAEGDLAALLGSCAASTACHARLLGL